jgi:predicted dehydrogenase
MRVVLVGAGNIAARYAACIAAEPTLTLGGATDVVPGRAADLVDRYGGTEYGALADVLADDAVDVVVNLTAPAAHAEVTAAALRAGKHVHTEKPVALDGAEAHELAALAQECGVRLSCAPSTLLGEAQQTLWKRVRDGDLGPVRVVYAEANWGRIETWHPAPEGLYASGPTFDVGIYPLTILTGIFGPVRRVVGYATTLEPQRVRRDGVPFTLSRPDFYVAALELESGVVARLTATFWVGPGKQRGLEVHGADASLWMPDWAGFASRLQRTTDGAVYEDVPLVRDPYPGTDWARPIADLAEAVAAGRPHRMGAEHAAHVVDVLAAIDVSRRDGGPVEVNSSFPPVAPMDWAR